MAMKTKQTQLDRATAQLADIGHLPPKGARPLDYNLIVRAALTGISATALRGDGRLSEHSSGQLADEVSSGLSGGSVLVAEIKRMIVTKTLSAWLQGGLLFGAFGLGALAGSIHEDSDQEYGETEADIKEKPGESTEVNDTERDPGGTVMATAMPRDSETTSEDGGMGDGDGHGEPGDGDGDGESGDGDGAGDKGEREDLANDENKDGADTAGVDANVDANKDTDASGGSGANKDNMLDGGITPKPGGGNGGKKNTSPGARRSSKKNPGAGSLAKKASPNPVHIIEGCYKGNDYEYCHTEYKNRSYSCGDFKDSTARLRCEAVHPSPQQVDET